MISPIGSNIIPKKTPIVNFRNTRKTTAEFIADAKIIHGDRYDYSKVVYQTARTKVTIVCSVHGDFTQIPSGHTSGQGCRKCRQDILFKFGRDVLEQKAKTFAQRANVKHDNKYDYSQSVYKGIRTKLIIGCPIHGPFYQSPNDHLSGYGCPKCKIESLKRVHTYTTATFIKLATAKHGNKYDYSLSVYKGTHEKIRIKCPVHGVFEQSPRQHLRGNSGGCLACAGLFKTTTDFTTDAAQIHQNYYNYSATEYVNANTKVVIICPVHGEFLQRPSVHLSGSGCTKCGCHQFSGKSIKWLASQPRKYSIQHAENLGEYRIPGTKFKVDGYCKVTNTVFEFYGDVFHGNPKIFDPLERCHPFHKHLTAANLLQNTMDREQKLRSLGYNLITMWESDWDYSRKCEIGG